MSVFKYRVLKSTWGVSIDMEAICRHLSGYEGNPVRTSEKLFFAAEVKYITERQAHFLHLGFETMAAEIDALFKGKEPVVVIVKEISFNPCDYQDEGLACAVMGWISQEFGITAPEVNVTFDKAENYYNFQFPKTDYSNGIN